MGKQHLSWIPIVALAAASAACGGGDDDALDAASNAEAGNASRSTGCLFTHDEIADIVGDIIIVDSEREEGEVDTDGDGTPDGEFVECDYEGQVTVGVHEGKSIDVVVRISDVQGTSELVMDRLRSEGRAVDAGDEAAVFNGNGAVRVGEQYVHTFITTYRLENPIERMTGLLVAAGERLN